MGDAAMKDLAKAYRLVEPAKVVSIDYTNHRGERGVRKIVPVHGGIVFRSSEWHREPQWLLDALDIDKDEIRCFAIASIHSWTPEGSA
jgi:predicted DNA-binding transcriptional regulator YafY